ncbi:MAG: hypothetical protein JXQ29_02750 [Planctomycetes bacterium]|nr:hypothetical protein [Planctomycetota bacterium]
MSARTVLASALLAAVWSMPARAGDDDPVEKTFHLDFSSGSRSTNFDAVELDRVIPNAQDRKASLLFRVVGSSAVRVQLKLPEAPVSAVLALEHLSSGGEVPHGGESVIAVSVNGYEAIQRWDVGCRVFSVDRVQIGKYLAAGTNVLEVKMVGGRTCYWLRKLEIACVFSSAAALDPRVERIPAQGKSAYAVVVGRGTHADPGWRQVVDALVEKYQAVVIVHPGAVEFARDELAAVRPRHACFVGRPQEVGRRFVVAVHRMTRTLDADPWTDVIWGILTGFRAEDALAIASDRTPLEVKRAAGGCGIELESFTEGAWYSECEQGVMHERLRGKPAEKKTCAPDTTGALVRELNENRPDLFVTSGHATERDWQIGYSYKNGQFRCAAGQLFGLDLAGKRFDIRSTNPKVYCPWGNCLMGHIDGPEAMAIAWMKTGGVRQMFGYVVSTWYGAMGTGVLPYFLGSQGRLTLAESFFLSNQALLERLEREFPGSLSKSIDQFHIEADKELIQRLARQLRVRSRDELGLLWDRDTVAFYGDPAWEARVARVREPDFEGELTASEAGDGRIRFVFRVKANVEKGFARPPAALLPHRIAEVKVEPCENADLTVADDFVLLRPRGTITKGWEARAACTGRKAE